MNISPVLICAFSLMNLAFMAIFLYAIKMFKQQCAEECIRISVLAESALNHMRAKSLDELYTAQNLKKSHDLQLEYLKDTYAKQKKQEQVKAKAAEPQFAKTVDGEEIDLREFEVMS